MSIDIKKQALDFLKSKNTMVIATIDVNGEPHASTVYFTADDDFSLYFVAGIGSQKEKNILLNSKIAFVIGFGPNPITIQGGGRAEKIDNENESALVMKIVDRIDKERRLEWPSLKIPGNGLNAFKIQPSWLVWLNLDKVNYPESYAESCHKII